MFVDVTVVVTVLVTTDVTATALTTGEKIDRITNATTVDNVIQIFMVSDQIVTGRTATK